MVSDTTINDCLLFISFFNIYSSFTIIFNGNCFSLHSFQHYFLSHCAPTVGLIPNSFTSKKVDPGRVCELHVYLSSHPFNSTLTPYIAWVSPCLAIRPRSVLCQNESATDGVILFHSLFVCDNRDRA